MALSDRSKQLRRDIIALSSANGGYHYGGCFSCVEILIALFDYVLTEADRFILSKGHACWGLYVLLQEEGLKPLLEGHPHLDQANGVNWTTGSMGHGFPAGVGMALARKMAGVPGKIYVLMGDGECQEGTTWEALLIAGRYKLDNLVVIVDYNKIQGSDFVENILSIARPLQAAAHAAGWLVSPTVSIDGHDVQVLIEELQKEPFLKNPQMIIANTIKGKGVSFMENQAAWHEIGRAHV